MSLTDFLHGVQFIKNPISVASVTFARSSVIGLIGTAPTHLLDDPNDATLNDLIRVTSRKNAAQYFGPNVPGFTIPYALDAIYDQRVSLSLVVNVWDPATMKTSVTDEAVVFAADELVQVVANPDKGIYNVVVANTAGDTTYVEDTDYTLNKRTGTITRLSTGAIGETESVNVDYDYPDLTAVSSTEIIGETTGAGLRTGMQALLNGFSLFGYDARVILAPGFSSDAGVATEMGVIANRIRGHYLIDAPVGATVDEAIAGRNGTDPVSNFATSNPRAVLCYPHVKASDGSLQPLSGYMAGVIARTHAELGYWHSPSNKEIQGIIGTEIPLTSSHVDTIADVQLLNAAGIATVYGALSDSTFGTGYRTWGNRSAAYPSTTTSENFINQLVIEDQLFLSIQLAMFQYIDRPISRGLIEAILETVRSFIRYQKSLGALIDGNCWFDPEDNPATEMSAGHLTFTLDYIGPPPLEKATFKSSFNINYLAQLAEDVAGRSSIN